MITISTRLLKEAEHRIDIGEIDGCSCCIYRDDCRGVYSIGGEPQFPFCADATLGEHFDLEQYKEMIKEEWDDMNLLEKICKELEVEINKKWLGSDGFHYCIDKSGQIEVLTKDDKLLNYGYIYWEDIFTGLLKPVWRPKERDAYYIPNINARMENIRYNVRYWNNDECDKFYLANGMVFKTIQEAIEATNKMLEAIKEEGE